MSKASNSPQEQFDRIQRVNLVSAIPVVGQLIGLATMATNLGKMFAESFELLYRNATGAADEGRTSELKSRLVNHLKYVGIGFTRAIPVVGGLALWGAKIAPLDDRKFTVTTDSRVTQVALDALTKPDPVLSNKELAVLTVPGVGLLYGIGRLIVSMGNTIVIASHLAQNDAGKRKKAVTDLKRECVRMGVTLTCASVPVIPGLVFYNSGKNRQNENTSTPAAQPAPAPSAVVPTPAKQHPVDEENAKLQKVYSKRVPLVLGDAYLDRSQYEGGKVEEGHLFWQNVLSADHGINVDLSKTARDGINQDFDDFTRLNALLISGDKNQYAKEVLRRLKERGRCVIPILTQGKEAHISAAVIEKRGDTTVYYLLNSGAGSENFPSMIQDNKVKKSYHSPVRNFNQTVITDEPSEPFQFLIELLFNAYQQKIDNRDQITTELIGRVFHQLSFPAEDQAIDGTHFITPQRSGTCSEQVFRMILRDNLLHVNSPNPQQVRKYKRLIASAKYLALLHMMQNPQEFSKMTQRKLTQAVAHTFTESAKAGYIDDEEVEILEITVNQMTNITNGINEASRLPLVPITHIKRGDFGVLPKPPEIPEVSRGMKRKHSQSFPEGKSPEEIILGCNEFTSEYLLTAMLPIPAAGGENDPYSHITAEQSWECIQRISERLRKIKERDPKEKFDKETDFLDAIHLTALVDRLAQNIPELDFDAYSIVPTDAVMKRLSESIHVSEVDHKRAKELTEYVKKRHQVASLGDEFAKPVEALFSELKNFEKGNGSSVLGEYCAKFLNAAKKMRLRDTAISDITMTGLSLESYIPLVLAKSIVMGIGFSMFLLTEDPALQRFRFLLDTYSNSNAIFCEKKEMALDYRLDISNADGRSMQLTGIPASNTIPERKPFSVPLNLESCIDENSAFSIGGIASLPRDVHHDFAAFHTSKELTVASAISWARSRVFEADSSFWPYLFSIFLTGDGYTDAVNREPEIRANLHGLILEKVAATPVKDVGNLVNWILLGIWTEGRIAAAGNEKDVRFLNKLNSLLLEKTRGLGPILQMSKIQKKNYCFIRQLIFLLNVNTLEPEPSKEKIQNCMVNLFLRRFINPAIGLSKVSSVKTASADLGNKTRLSEAMLEQFFENDELKIEVGNQILAGLGISPAPTGKWTSPGWPILEFQENGKTKYQINITDGILLVDGKPVISDIRDGLFRSTATEYGIDLSKPLIISRDSVKAIDGSFEIINKTSKFSFVDEFVVRKRLPGTNFMVTSVTNPSGNPLFFNHPYRRVWSREDGTLFITDKTDHDKILATWTREGVKKETSDGEELYLAGASSIPDEVTRIFSNFAGKNVCYWSREVQRGDSGTEASLGHVELYSGPYSINFKACVSGDKMTFESEEFKGFSLVEDTESLGPLAVPGVLIIEKEGRRKAIIPTLEANTKHPFDWKPGSGRFVTPESYYGPGNSETFVRLSDKPYFVCDFDQDGLPNPRDRDQITYLAYLYASMGEYVLAKEMLSRIGTYGESGENSERLVRCFRSILYPTPEAIAFASHVEEFFEKSLISSNLFMKTYGRDSKFSHFTKGVLPSSLAVSVKNPVTSPLRPKNEVVRTVNMNTIKKPSAYQDRDPSIIMGATVPTSTIFWNLFLLSREGPRAYGPIDLVLLKNQMKVESDLRWSEDADLLHLLKVVRLYPESFAHINVEDPNAFDELIKAAKKYLVRFEKEERYEKVRPSSLQPVGSRRRDPRQQQTKESTPPLSVRPCHFLVDQYLEVDEKVRGSTDSPLTHMPHHPLGRKLMEGVNEAFTSIGGKKIANYTLSEGNNSVGLLQAIVDKREAVNRDLKDLSKKINALANSRESAADYEKKALDRMDHLRKGESPITHHEVLVAMGTRDREALRLRNPFLTDDQLDELFDAAIEYMLLHSLENQLGEAKKALSGDHPSLQDAGDILSRSREFNPEEHPELLFYEYATGLMLRSEPDQAGLLIKLFDVLFNSPDSPERDEAIRRVCFEFQAGGGKTKVISVILAMKSIQAGKVPFFFSLPPLFDVVSSDLRETLMSVFKTRVVTIDVDLKTPLTPSYLSQIYRNLKAAKEMGFCVVLKPEAFHALNLCMQSYITGANPDAHKTFNFDELVEARGANKFSLQMAELLAGGPIWNIMNFFKEEGVFLVDESHQNIHALMSTNVAVGNPKELPLNERSLILQAYSMMSLEEEELTLKDGRSVVDVLRLKDNLQAQVSPDDLALCLDAVTDALIDDLAEKWDLHDKVLIDALKQYAKDKSCPLPEELKAFDQNKRDLMALTRGLRLYILPTCFSLVGEMDYGASDDRDDLSANPRDKKNSVHAKFENPYMASCLTCAHVFQQGINDAWFKKLILRMVEDDKEGAATLSEAFREFQGEGAIELRDIDEVFLADEDNLKRLQKQVGRFPPLLQMYLEKLALQSVTVASTIKTSRGADLVEAPWGLVQFSATMGRQELYPLAHNPTHYWLDRPFLARVAGRLCQEANRTVHYLEPGRPKELFQKLYEQNKASFNSLEGLIDMGFWCKEALPKDWALAFNEFAKEKGIPFAGSVFFMADANGVKRLCYLPVDSKDPIIFQSNNLKVELEALGLDKERVFKIYGPDETTGTDLQLSPNAKMIVSVGENSTFSDSAQAVMRMRQFLKDSIDTDQSQTTLWVVPESLQPLIAQEGDASMPSLLAWMMDNEGKIKQEALVSAALQDIDHLVRITAASKHLDRANSGYKNTKAFIKESGISPYALWGEPPIQQDVVIYLEEYVKRAFAEAELDPAPYKDEIVGIINRTKALIEKVETGRTDLMGKARQQSKQVQLSHQKQREQEMNQLGGARFIPAAPKQDATNESSLQTFDLESAFFIDPLAMLEVIDSPPKDLLFTENLLLTAHMGSDADAQVHKPIEYLLVIEEKGKRQAIACAATDAQAWAAQMREGQVRDGVKVALFTVDGKVCQHAKGEHRLALDESDKWFHDVVVYSNLMNGQVVDRDHLMRRYQGRGKELVTSIERRKQVLVDGSLRFRNGPVDNLRKALTKRKRDPNQLKGSASSTS